MLKFPQVPEDLTGLAVAELEALEKSIKGVLATIKGGTVDLSQEEAKRAKEYAAPATAETPGHLARIKGEFSRRAEEQAEADRLQADIEAALAEAPEVVEDPEESEDPDASTETDDEDDEDETVASGSAPAPAPKVPARPRGTGAATSVKERPQVSSLIACDGVPNHPAGQAFTDWSDLAAAMVSRFENMGSSKDLVPVARVKANFPDDRKLGEASSFNLAKFEPNELEAALCAPCTPYYGLACLNTDRRPVFGSLPGFEAPRGCVTVMASPSLSDIDNTAYGTWTFADDDNPAAVKGPCQTIDCTDPSSFQLYGIYRCLTVKNLLQMTYPELVEAYLNRLAAATARYAEIQLLDAMGGDANVITAPNTGYSANQQVTSQILTLLTAIQERERWDINEAEMWAPRWLLAALRVDGIRRKNITGGLPRLPSEAEVNAQLTNIGITPHWTLDTPTWGVPAPRQPNANGHLVGFPSAVNVLFAPRGKFALIDRGELRVGVTGGNIYRDTTQLLHNEFSMFFESFEGVVNTTSCPADILQIPLCLSGAQVADAISTCTGVNDDLLNDAS